MAKNTLAVGKAEGKYLSRRSFFRGIGIALAAAALPAAAISAASAGAPRETLTDHEVELLAEMVEERVAGGMTPSEAYRDIAATFERQARLAR